MECGDFIVVDSELKPLGPNESGELCLSGNQLTPGYWMNPTKNESSFFFYNGKRYYRTGDLCFVDNDGDLQYIGRIDFQTKINGFRVELSEIEHYAAESLNGNNICVCVAYQNAIGTTELGLMIQGGQTINTEAVVDYIREHLPPYEATKKAMDGLVGAIIATSLVLAAVFVPVSFLSGITGQLYRLLSVTIAISVLLSTVVALT